MTEAALKPGWKLVKISDCCEQISNRIINPSESGYERFVGLEHMQTREVTIRDWGKTADVTSTMKEFKAGDVLVARRNVYLERAGTVDFNGVCSGDAIVLRAHDEPCLPELLPFILNTDQFWAYANSQADGSMSKRLSVARLLDYEFPLPPLDEQRRIAQMLSSVEENINALQNAHHSATTLWRSISANEFNRVLNSPVEKLDNHYSIVNGQVDPQDNKYAGFTLIAPNHIEGGTGNLLKLETAREQGAISGKYLFDEGAIIYSKIRPNLKKVVIAPCRGLCSADMYPLIPEPTLRKEYLLEILLSDKFTLFAVSLSMRTGMPKLNRDQLSRYKCVIPSLAQQDKYLKFTRGARNAREEISDRLNKANQIKMVIFQEVWG